MLNCNKCFKKCKAECCIFVPFNKKFLEAHKDKFQRPVLMYHRFSEINENVVIPIVKIDHFENGIPCSNKKEQICPFLNEQHRCVIYDERPELCKMFGTTKEPDNNFTCHYHLGKDYSFPDDGTPEKAAIDFATITNKYNNLLSNEKLIEDFEY